MFQHLGSYEYGSTLLQMSKVQFFFTTINKTYYD